MSLDNFKEDLDNIQDNVKSYVDSNLAYYKLLGFKVTMKSLTLLVKFFIISVFLLLFLFFGSVAFAIFLGKYFENSAFGFLLVALLNLFIGLIFYFFKDKLIDKPMLEKFSEIFFND